MTSRKPMPAPPNDGVPVPIDRSEWVDEEKVDRCMRCRSMFTSFAKRKRRCYTCGGVFCAQCIENKNRKMGEKEEKMPTCLDCLSPTNNVIDSLKRVYNRKIKPCEELYLFPSFHYSVLRDADLEAKPMVLLLGQYSVGKTSFIKYMLERDFPGARIGPEPTTDKFAAIMYGDEDRIIPGNALSVQSDKPFHGLDQFGTAFLSRFEATECKSKILRDVTFIDTPGVLSGEKQRIGRSYDYPAVVRWFAERCDMILLLFDAHKLDISDEFRRVIEQLKGQDDKVRVVLNKADKVNNQQLMRVYGALMWSLGKVIKTPEVMRVYISSFWEKQYDEGTNHELFDAEKADLLRDLHELPHNSTMRKINSMVKRARTARVHAHIISYMRDQMPTFYKDKAKKKMIDELADVFNSVRKMKSFAIGDFPDVAEYQEILKDMDFMKFPHLNEQLVSGMEDALGKEIPRIMAQLMPPKEEKDEKEEKQVPEANPFDSMIGVPWEVSADEKAECDTLFTSLNPTGGRLNGDKLRPLMLESGLTAEKLRIIWSLCDMEKKGSLDADEFALAQHLMAEASAKPNEPMMTSLPLSYVPPAKRTQEHVAAAVAAQKTSTPTTNAPPADAQAPGALCLYDVSGTFYGYITADGTCVDRNSKVIGFINKDTGEAGTRTRRYLGCTKPGNNSNELYVTNASDDLIAILDLGTCIIKSNGGTSIAEITTAGEVKGNLSSLVLRVENFNMTEIKTLAAYLVLVNPTIVQEQ